MRTFESRDFEQTVRQVIESELDADSGSPVLTYIEGGHYDPRFTEDFDMDFPEASLRAACELATNLVSRFNRDIRIVLGVLIDDLGQECGVEGSCTMPKQQAEIDLPDVLSSVIHSGEYPILKPDKIVYLRERAAKNRAIKTLKRLISSDAPHLRLDEAGDDSHCVIYTGAEQDVRLADFHGHVWVPKCPAIMAQHYADVLMEVNKRFFRHHSSSPRVIVDFSEACDRVKVNNGARVALDVFIPSLSVVSRANIINIAALDDSVTDNFIDHYKTR